MLSASNIVQTNQGSTGGTNASSVTVTLPAATAAGHQLIVAVVAATGADQFGTTNRLLLPSPFSTDGSIDTFAPVPHLIYGSKDTTAGETSWTVQLQKPNGTSATDAMCWFVAEVSGLHAHPAKDPNVGCGAAKTTAATTLVLTDDLGLTAAADEVCLAFFANHAASGTPKTVASVTNTTTQPGTWTRLGSTVATTNSSGPNVRLDAYDKFPNAVGKRDATVTWSASVTGASGLVTAYTS
jgi:hypothetical protein